MNYLIIFGFLILLFRSINSSWNISESGFLLKSTEYSEIRSSDYYSIVFWTKQHNGILLYATGEDNYMLLELYHGAIRFSIQFIAQDRHEPYIGWIGSGLADYKPHQLEIYQEVSSAFLVLDRGLTTVKISWPLFTREYDSFKIKRFFIGGYPSISELDSIIDRFKSLSLIGFVGCIEEAIWNNVNLVYRAYVNNSVPYCTPKPFVPLTFTTPKSYIMLNRQPQAYGLKLSFDVLLYLNYSTIFYNNDGNTILNISVTNGSFYMKLNYGSIDYINAFLPQIKLNDGRWHHILVGLPGKDSLNGLNVFYSVDDEVVLSKSSFSYDTSRDLMFGGNGFIGCINNLYVDDQPYRLSAATKKLDVVENGCNFTDYCVPNPCQHGGYCNLGLYSFSCQCPLAYSGVVCDDAVFYPTCAVMYTCGYKEGGDQTIDVDGVGPLDPVPVVCLNMESSSEQDVMTAVDTLLVASKLEIKNEPNTWAIPYALTVEQLRLLTRMSAFCTQEVTYKCSSSRITDGNNTLLVWIGGDGLVHEYWNSQEVYGRCECYIEDGSCSGKPLSCNCDADDYITRYDKVVFDNKNDLPIIGISAMNISSFTGKSATLEIGPLRCSGLGADIEGVTFQETFSYIPLPDVNFADPGSIQFEFRTDTTRGNVVIFNQGRPQNNYFVIQLTSPYKISALFSLGGPSYDITVEVNKSKLPFDDNQFHAVFFKVSRTTAYLIADGVTKQINLPYNFTDYKEIDSDNTPLYIGGSPYNMFSGFKGTIRRMYINGKLLNLPEYAQFGLLATAGVYPALLSSCLASSNICNYGECIEHYNYYMCNCSTSPFYGKHCENEVGVLFETSSSSLSYKFITNNQIIVRFTLSIGFKTTGDGLLLSIRSNEENVFLALDIYKGNLRFSINLYPDRTYNPDIFIYYNTLPPYKFSDGLPHVVQVRINRRELKVVIDGKQNLNYLSYLRSTDGFLTNSRYIFIANAPPLTNFPTLKFSQFNGCMGGVKVVLNYLQQKDPETVDILKSFQAGHTNIISNDVTTGKCFGPLPTYPPAKLLETPPNLIPGGETTLNSGALYSATSSTTVIIGIIVLVVFCSVLGVILFLRWYSRNFGVYVTEEGKLLERKTEKIQSKRKENTATAFPKVQVDEMEGWYL